MNWYLAHAKQKAHQIRMNIFYQSCDILDLPEDAKIRIQPCTHWRYNNRKEILHKLKVLLPYSPRHPQIQSKNHASNNDKTAGANRVKKTTWYHEFISDTYYGSLLTQIDRIIHLSRMTWLATTENLLILETVEYRRCEKIEMSDIIAHFNKTEKGKKKFCHAKMLVQVESWA